LIHEYKMKEIFILAGEASGDMHGASLMKSMKAKMPSLHFFGIGGDQMIAQGLDSLYHSSQMAFLGFFEVIRHLGFISKVFNKVLNSIKERQPALIIFIDYPGFNLRMAHETKKLGFRNIYYISPQVWAWGRGRVQKIARYIDRMLVILPFEYEIYKEAGMDVHFVGHPLKGTISPGAGRQEFFSHYGLYPDRPVIGILPGSRKQEISKLLPEMSRACDYLKNNITDAQFVLGMAPHLNQNDYLPYLKNKTSIIFIEGDTYGVMAYSKAVCVASGTATLETALLGTPMVICYKISPLSYILGRLLIKLKYIGLVNIISGRQIVPELIQQKANAGSIADTLSNILTSNQTYQQMQKELKQVSEILGKGGASDRASDLILELV
jgi:lipid-A-disaccharide synthase